jgi:hypothetical protein
MTRDPKFFTTLSSTNLAPDDPVRFEIHASTHHWRGTLLEDTWATAELRYDDPYQTENAYRVFKDMFLAIQETTEPSQDIQFVKEMIQSVVLSDQERLYYDAVALVTSNGWAWGETFNENQITGERKTMGSSHPFNLSLSTWEWGGKSLGGSVYFSHFQREDESKTELLLRTFETAEKAKHDFPDSIPCTDIYGAIKRDEFKTRIVFG